MLAVLDHLSVIHVPQQSSWEDLLHELPRLRGEPHNLLIPLLENGCKVSLSQPPGTSPDCATTSTKGDIHHFNSHSNC